MVNRATIIGLLGADPDVRIVDGATKIARIRVATTERWRDKATGETKTATEWHNVQLWTPLAEVAQNYLRKGSLVYVGGKMQTQEYQKDGQKHYMTVIRANELKMLDRKSQDKPTNAEPPTTAEVAPPNPEDYPDDLPF